MKEQFRPKRKEEEEEAWLLKKKKASFANMIRFYNYFIMYCVL